MSFTSRIAGSMIAVLALASGARADNYLLGGALAADSEDGRALSAFADYGMTDNTWISGTLGATETSSAFGNFNTTFADVGIDHNFEPIGIRVGAAYWGDSSILDSADWRTSLYYRNTKTSISADYERRNFDFVFASDRLRGATKAEFHADGLGGTGRFNVSDNTTLRVSGMVYDYSRNIRLQRDIDRLRFLSASRLSLINSLIDYRYSASVEYRFGLRSVEFSVGALETAVDQSKVDSYTLGFVTPMTDRTDIEFRLSVDESENFGSTTALTVYLYYFGGT